MKTLRRLLPYLKKELPMVGVAFLFAALSSFFKLAVPFLTGLSIDKIRQGDYEISTFLIFMAGCLLLGAIFRYFFDIFTAIVAQKAVKRLRDDVYDAVNRAPISYLDRSRQGDLILRLVTDIENVQSGLITGASAMFEGAVQVLITIGFMFYLNWMLGLLVVLLTPISVLVSRFISNRNSRYFKNQSADLGKISSYGLETLNTIEALHSYGLESAYEEEFDRRNQAFKKSSFKAMFAACWINPASRLVNGFIYGCVIVLGVCFLLFPDAFAGLGIAFTLGGLSAFLTYAYQYMAPFNEIADAMSEVLYAASSLRRVDELVSCPRDIDEGSTPIEGGVETLEAQDVTFSYDGNRTVIDRFSIDIWKGHKIALVGPTGCGKTTIINLLMRFYDPDRGLFLTNGIDTKEVSKAELRSHMGMVLQDTWLCHGTIAENIAFGRPEASREDIIAAATLAHADEFIRRLAKGYDTEISSSSGLSSGEKQLLCVARILLLAPEIVLLDEATSNIDLRTELLLSEGFDTLMKDKTSIVVAHRLSTIKNADLILVMDQGRIVEQGNFAELMSKNGFFADLYNAQLS